MPLLIVALALAVTVPLVVALLRANELFFLRVRDGRIHIARGRIPQGLLDDIGDVLADPRVTSGTLRGVSEDGRVRLYPEADLTEGQKQRLRNVIAQWPVTRVRNANLPRKLPRKR
jgi:hypothetical protein